MDFVEKPKVSPPPPPPAKSSPLDSSAIKSSEKSVEKKVQSNVEAQKEPIVEQKLDWKNSLKSFELQEQATLEGQFKKKIKKPLRVQTVFCNY